MITQLILALAILVSLHEWGHYIAARAFGIRIEKFFIFFDAFGKKLFSKKIKDTEWGIGWLPLGGYVKIAGMIDESLDKEQLKSEPKEDEFRGKPAWQRLIVMIGGVTVNLILGLLIFSLMLFHYGEDYIPNATVMNGGGIMVSELGAEAGLQNGDKIYKVNGTKAERFSDLFVVLEDSLVYEVERDGKTFNVVVDDSISTKMIESKGDNSSLFTYRHAAVVEGFTEGGRAEAFGFQPMDKIVGVDTLRFTYYDELKSVLGNYANQKTSVWVDREGELVQLDVEVDSNGMLGIGVTSFYEYEKDIVHVEYGFFESFPKGISNGMSLLAKQVKGFGKMTTGKIDATKSVMGPIQMTKLFGAEWDWYRFWRITAVISLILAFMNMLPIPALDGGHVLFLLVEIIIRRPLPDKFMYVMQVIGMVILFSLMAFIFGVDILSFFK